MTNEEKKAIEKIKNILYMFPESEELKLLLNLIEKQSKEIECLSVIHDSYKEMFEENNYISKHKIKAKMKEKEWALKNYDCGESDYKQSQAIGAWIALQSLLEEE